MGDCGDCGCFSGSPEAAGQEAEGSCMLQPGCRVPSAGSAFTRGARSLRQQRRAVGLSPAEPLTVWAGPRAERGRLGGAGGAGQPPARKERGGVPVWRRLSRGKDLDPERCKTVFQAARRPHHCRVGKESSMTPRKKLEGLVAATVTPMTPDGQINLTVIHQYVEYLVSEQNVKNVFVNGTTGEGLSLSIQERKQLAEEWICQGKNKLDHVIIHVGALSLPESQELARHAASIGASGIAVIAPFFFKPTNKDELIAFLQKVASEAPAVPFYYYHIPHLTGVKIHVEELLDGIKKQIPTFQGVKFSDTDLLDLAQCINKNESEQFAFLYGVDEQLLSALAIGANGAVGSTFNYLGRKTNLMLQAFAKPDLALAQKYQFLTVEFLSFVIKLGFGVAQTKAVMTFVSGIPMGPPRLPLVSASEEFIIKAKAKLDSIVWPDGD